MHLITLGEGLAAKLLTQSSNTLIENMNSQDNETRVTFECPELNLSGDFFIPNDFPPQKLKQKVSELIDIPPIFLTISPLLPPNDPDPDPPLPPLPPLPPNLPTLKPSNIKITIQDFPKLKAFNQLKQSIMDNSLELLSAIDKSLSLTEIVNLPAFANDWTCLHFACSVNSTEVLDEVLKFSHEIINQETSDSWTPLMLAAAHGNLQSCKKILKLPSTQINFCNKRGSALHIAVMRDQKSIVELLLLSKASLSTEDEKGKRPIELTENQEILELIAKFQGNLEICKYAQEAKPTFVGEVFLYNSGIFVDSSCFLNINLEKGVLEEFCDKISLLSKVETKIFIYLVDIEEVKPRFRNSWNLKGNFYFQIMTEYFQPVYYVKCQEVRDEWIEKIKESIEYCRAHHIGLNRKSLASSHLFKVLEGAKERVSYSVPAYLDVDAFDRMSELGSGSFASVYKVQNIATGQLFAMKCLSKKFLEKKRMLSYAISEIGIMKELDHPFILKLVHSIDTAMCIYLILEYCEQGDLEGFMEKKKLSENLSKFYLAQIVLALEYLHSKNVIYRDLKPANILIDRDGNLRLADFGLAKEINESEMSVSTIVGSPAYISPEILAREHITKATDKYALGIVMHQLLTNDLPFAQLEMDKIFSHIRKGQFKFSDKLARDAKELIKALTSRNPQKRPSYEQIKKHQFFKGIDWEIMLEKRYEPPLE